MIAVSKTMVVEMHCLGVEIDRTDGMAFRTEVTG
jgi:hypothetical protein